MSSREIVDFYNPAIQGVDYRGRTLDQILAWPDDTLEMRHDFIQILFPLPEGSMFNVTAPVIDERTYIAFRQPQNQKGGQDLRDGVRRALERMLLFYGFTIKYVVNRSNKQIKPRIVIHRIADKQTRRQKMQSWVRGVDHNHLRITRILRSLRTLGLDDEAAAFFRSLVKLRQKYGRISDRSFEYWTRAAQRPLWQAPDGDEVEWLKMYDDKMVEDEEAETTDETMNDEPKKDSPQENGESSKGTTQDKDTNSDWTTDKTEH